MNKGLSLVDKIRIICFVLIYMFTSISCKKLVEIDPPSEYMTEANVYTNDATAIAVLNGIYSDMNANGKPFQGNRSIALLTGLSADEFKLYSGFSSGLLYNYYRNSLSQGIGNIFAGSECWSPLYSYIFRCNAAIEGLNTSNSLSPSVRQQLLGEAKFLRAFFYFYLVNLFGDVPLALTTDPNVNTVLARTSKIVVYPQIIADLKEAEGLLSNTYLAVTLQSTSTERARPTKWAVAALLARVYLYNKEWNKAEEKATAVINNISLFGPLPSLNDAFLKNSVEAIWQLQPTAIDFNTQEGQTLIIPSTGLNTSSRPVSLSNSLLNSFEAGDQRAIDGNWINSIIVSGITYRFPYKYKVSYSPGVTDAGGMTEYFMVLRLGEQYLIRAEARTQQNNIGGAQADLNAIRNRAGLGNTSAGDQASLLTSILNERQHELFSEWGHRWLDLKRAGKIDEIMNIATPLKSNATVQWNSFQALYPLPSADIQRNPNLIQNSGY